MRALRIDMAPPVGSEVEQMLREWIRYPGSPQATKITLSRKAVEALFDHLDGREANPRQEGAGQT